MAGDEDTAEEASPIFGAPSDNTTLTHVLRTCAANGFGADLRPVGHDGLVHCPACGNESPIEDFTEVAQRRMEGASDPADMLIVVAGRCPVCGTGGAVALSYGPEAGERDSDVVLHLPPVHPTVS